MLQAADMESNITSATIMMIIIIIIIAIISTSTEDAEWYSDG
jgi:hypothetical protein